MTSELSNDRAKHNPWTEDQLGYAPFAERLFRVVRDVDAKSGFVIGINGRWGSGKSTMVNFLCAYINKHNQEAPAEDSKILVVEFQPWLISGHHDLISSFFKVLSEKLKPRSGRIADRLRAIFDASGDSARHIIDAVAQVGALMNPSTALLSATAGKVASETAGTLLESWKRHPSLQVAHERLYALLGKTKRRIIVTIDDIDRLHDDEVRSIIQMVKSVGQLPNVVYVLTYDRRLVGAVLDDRPSLDGAPTFLEKVVQHELDLPTPTRNAVLKIFDTSLADMFKTIDEGSRWRQLVHDGVQRWIRTPRDATRLSNATKFMWAAVAGEVDPVDILVMEGLRLFDPETFEWIRLNRDFLLRKGRFVFSRDEELQTEGKRLRETIPELKRERVVSLLEMLFPGRAKIISGATSVMGGESFADTTRRRGVGSEGGYDTYFSVFPSVNAPSKVLLDRISTLRDPSEIEAILRIYLNRVNEDGDYLISETFEELRFRYSGVSAAQPSKEILLALFAIGEDVQALDKPVSFGDLSPRSWWSALITDIVEASADADRLLDEVVSHTQPASVLAQVYIHFARRAGMVPGYDKPHKDKISEAAIKRLGIVAMQSIDRARSSGALPNASVLWDILRTWSLNGNATELRDWIERNAMNSPTFLDKIAKGLLTYSTSGKAVTYALREELDEAIYDGVLLLKASEAHLDDASLTDDVRKRLTALKVGLQSMSETQSDSDSEIESDEELVEEGRNPAET